MRKAGEPEIEDSGGGERNRGTPASQGTGEVTGSGSGAGGGGAPEDIDDDPVGGGGRLPKVSGADSVKPGLPA